MDELKVCINNMKANGITLSTLLRIVREMYKIV